VVKVHLAPECFEQNSMVKSKVLSETLKVEKIEPFQRTKMPPDDPVEGRKSKQSKEGGQKFLMKE
jgi:hypothetical protein